AEDGIRDFHVTGVQTCALPILPGDDYGFAEQTAFRNLPTLHPYANNNPAYPAISTVDPQFSYGWIANGSSGQYLVDKKTIQLNGNIEVDILSGLKARMLGSYGFGNIQIGRASCR